MNLIESIILSGFDIVMLNLLTCSLLREKVSLRKIDLIEILLFIIMVGICSYYISNPVIALSVSTIIAFIMLLKLYKESIRETLFLYVISMVIVYCAQIIVMLIIKAIEGDILNNFSYGLISQISTLLIIAVVKRYIPIYAIYNYVVEKNKIVYYLLLNSFAVLIIIVVYWYVDIEGMVENLISILVLSIAIIFINFVIVRNGLKNQFKERELNIYKTYLPVIEQLMEDIRARQHEFDNHLQVLRMMQKIDTDNRKDDIDELINKYCTNIIEKNK